ncbi:hypothetical protein Pmar_PMAR019059 [Perkinsus marinus ATCC 50983]|uniref:Uncharacterized protein n=1 Tax=Perkinsus marinus (strain ATCC 50983 / TXsc) TaxID=423536 RepID=C5KTR5_PERM5|nr:hypothetical protein Pmar_PMAR019059 [Perkinsus marinus ATCC 50983]EER11957.1 hypothetical protein Pmar_PMAR019059 [Perkinsus marinus ATCC 50983]|eukprot:XP_002780162.1 hypothetical protein Pmar_PMAR019059 [Perkinsus marinus ATCC 50983]
MSLLHRVISRSPSAASQLTRALSTSSHTHLSMPPVSTGLTGVDLASHQSGKCSCPVCRSQSHIPGKCSCPRCSSVLPSSLTSRFMLAGSPLFLTEFDKPFYFPEVQFILSDKLNFIFERFFETECGVWLMNTLAVYTLMRMFFYYFWWQPSALNHFKDRYGQTWNVGHHLYGTDAPNPLKKETKGARH